MKIVHKIIFLLTILVILISTLAYDSIFNAAGRFNIRFETLKDESISEQFDNVNILFFSDLHYGSLWTDERLEKLKNTINDCSPDVILFGGDLILDENYDEESIARLTDFLNSLYAPLGKFCVFGEYDVKNEELVTSIYANSDFEILNNETIKLRNKGSSYIDLIGIDSYLDNRSDTSSVYDTVNKSAYTIVFAHAPDTFTLLNDTKTDYFMCGHTHGGQVNLLFKTTYEVQGASYRNTGKATINDHYTMDITTGVGNVDSTIRFLSYPEVVVYRLKHTDIPKE